MTPCQDDDLASLKILIVDDHATFRRTICDFLPGADVVECSDGSEVVERYAAERPDFVLMDIEMPIIDGLTATRQLLTLFPEARVILLSTDADLELADVLPQLSKTCFVEKEHLEKLHPLIESMTTQPDAS